ncbi:hypothetical protein [Risungbinella massiliensis]|uniref:hypothetical protein n=1 Tax=Risungbinella massiliensis TaxID=1329796 RepID=UPI0005CBD7A3|nr:hypothetical protein [Risungbinella massiliensis]
MKKLTLSSVGESDVRDVYLKRGKVLSIRENKNTWVPVHEKRDSYGTKDYSYLMDQYKNSLNKKRLLRIWEKNRKQVQIAPHLPEIIEHLIYENVYTDISSLLADCYREDFHLPYLEVTLQSWLEQQKMMANQLKREWDELFWDEVSQFIHKCSDIHLLSDFQPRQNYPN